MLRSSFIDKATAAGRMGHTIPVHKLGIKTGLPKCYEGEPDVTKRALPYFSFIFPYQNTPTHHGQGDPTWDL
jgi:hypothetical protein